MTQAPITSRSIDDDPGLAPGFQPGAPPVPNQPAPLGAPGPSGTGFAAVEAKGEPASSAMPSLVAAYVLMWLLLLGFVWLVVRRQARTEARLHELEQALLKPPPSP